MNPAVNLSASGGLGKKLIASPLFWALIALVFIFGAGYLTGRLTATKPKPFEIVSTPIEQPSPQGGAGLLIPESPSSPVSGPPALPVSALPQWHRFDDTLITIRCRAERADSIEYVFKKRWYEFTPQEPYITSLLVYGVAPESVKVQGKVTDPPSKNFSVILTATTQPSANILLGYKNFILHFSYFRESSILTPTYQPSIGVGYHFRF